MRNLSKIGDRELLTECRRRGYIINGNKRPLHRALSAIRRCETAQAEDILNDELLCDTIAVPIDQADQPALLRIMGDRP